MKVKLQAVRLPPEPHPAEYTGPRLIQTEGIYVSHGKTAENTIAKRALSRGESARFDMSGSPFRKGKETLPEISWGIMPETAYGMESPQETLPQTAFRPPRPKSLCSLPYSQ